MVESRTPFPRRSLTSNRRTRPELLRRSIGSSPPANTTTMSARKFGGSWWIDFSFDQVRYRKKSPENSRVGANAYELLLRGRLARGENIEARHVTAAELEFRTFAEKWFEDYVVPNNKPSEQKAKSYILTRSLVPFFGRTSLDRISANDVERYKLRESRRGTSNKTINNKLAVLRKCLASAW